MDPSTTSTNRHHIFQIKVDRQIRPVLLVVANSIRIKTLNAPIFSHHLLCEKSPLNELFSTVALPPKSSIMEFNGHEWARSQMFHLKLFIQPKYFLSLNLYPQWTELQHEFLLDKFEQIFDPFPMEILDQHFSKLEKSPILNESNPTPNGKLHGYIYNHLCPSDPASLSNHILKFEKFLFPEYGGAYKIYIYRITDELMCLSSVLNEKTFASNHPELSHVMRKYIPRKRLYYRDFQSGSPRAIDFNYPTTSTLSKRTFQRNRDPVSIDSTILQENTRRKPNSFRKE